MEYIFVYNAEIIFCLFCLENAAILSVWPVSSVDVQDEEMRYWSVCSVRLRLRVCLKGTTVSW